MTIDMLTMIIYNLMAGLVLLLLAAVAYFLKDKGDRDRVTEGVTNELAKAVVALQGAVQVLQAFNDAHARSIEQVRQERRECEQRCPYRNGDRI